MQNSDIFNVNTMSVYCHQSIKIIKLVYDRGFKPAFFWLNYISNVFIFANVCVIGTFVYVRHNDTLNFHYPRQLLSGHLVILNKSHNSTILGVHDK